MAGVREGTDYPPRSRKEPGVGELRQQSSTRRTCLIRLNEILRSVLDGIRETAEAEVERAGGFCGPVTEEQRDSSITLDLVNSALDSLAMQPEERSLSYSEILECTEGLPPYAASVKWVHSLDPEDPVSERDSILIPVQARIDRRILFELEAGLDD
jgi:hypothetical protein